MRFIFEPIDSHVIGPLTYGSLVGSFDVVVYVLPHDLKVRLRRKKMARAASDVALLQTSSCNLSLLRRTLSGEEKSNQDFAAATDLSKVSAPSSLEGAAITPADAELRMPRRDIGEALETVKA